ncbi:hypothetical protein DEO45_15245 [Rhodanobacter denitrificans]|uniref:DUF3077 domain-containing protein n=1 Tax=Rhodanobacter denitrificans TaxID=666685 RepID=A0A368KCR8_9GAMM|nr:hypothetical protein [Rhodanobacter denitrificans]RCS28775.1 hypothetical protein DEO45_15245 [Rhodanobacter denitrificans]
MAKSDHTAVARDAARLPTNPLSRPYWTLAEADFGQHEAATLAGITIAIRALARVLANSEAFRDLHANSQSDAIEPGCSPLDAPTTEGLFAALYFLSEQAEQLSQLPIPARSI